MAKRQMPLYRRRLRRRPLFFIFLTAFLVLSVQGYYYVERRLAPVVRDYADMRVVQIAEGAIIEAIKKRIDELPNIRQLLIKEYDPDHNVVAISLDAGAASRVQALAQESMLQKLDELSRQKFEIPLGVALNSEILANVGPRIPVTLIPIGATEVELEPAVEETGINNVLLTLYLNVKVRVKVIIPFSSNEAVVAQRIAIAQELIVGKVPQYYFKGGTLMPLPFVPPAEGSGPNPSPPSKTPSGPPSS
ncbi:MAG: sporulation protein YunB [Hydrogenibacillus sp.]|nr:sporulation protein YunB [Hydrogenibacillus sp.]